MGLSPEEREIDGLLAGEGAPPFTRPAFTRVLAETFGFPFRYIVSRSADGDVCGAMPCFGLSSLLFGRRLVTAPFNFYGGLAARGDRALEDLLGQAREASTGRRWFEIKATSPLPDELVARFDLAVRRDFLTYEVPLGSEKEVERRQHSRLRERLRSLRRELGPRLAFSTAACTADLAAFHRLLTREYLRKHLMLPLPFALFRRLWLELSPAREAEVLMARIDGRLAAGVFLLHDGGRVLYQWGAYDLGQGHRSPLKILLDEAIRHALSQGCEVFDLGLTARAHEGLRFFKTRWGGVERPLPWYYMLSPGERVPHLSYDRSFAMIRKVFRLVPVVLARAVPPMLIRHLA